MRIYTLPVKTQFQPLRQDYICPAHNEQWSIEQDFAHWLKDSWLFEDRQSEADWDYLPIFWNRYYINNSWGEGGLDDLQDEILRLVSRNRSTFTVCEYDIHAMQPQLDLCGMLVFIGSRRGERGIDVPLLCTEHPYAPRDRSWLASFCGNAGTYAARTEMVEQFDGREGVKIKDAQKGTEYFRNLMLESYIGLAPRGQGAQSYRFYEAMNLGAVPLYISDIDCRPFKQWIDWDSCSFYAPTAAEAVKFLDTPIETLEHMGQRAQRVYQHELRYGKWPIYLIKELTEGYTEMLCTADCATCAC